MGGRVVVVCLLLVVSVAPAGLSQGDGCVANMEEGTVSGCENVPEEMEIHWPQTDPVQWCIAFGNVAPSSISACRDRPNSTIGPVDRSGKQPSISLADVGTHGDHCKDDVCNVTVTVQAQDGGTASASGRVDLGNEGGPPWRVITVALATIVAVGIGGATFVVRAGEKEESLPHQGGSPTTSTGAGGPAGSKTNLGGTPTKAERRVKVRAADADTGEDITQKIEIQALDGEAEARRGPKAMTIAHPAGRAYEIEVTADGYEPERVSVSDSTAIGGLDVELARQRGTLTVEVLDADGRGRIPGLDVTVVHNRTRTVVAEATTEEERFEGSLPHGRYTVSLAVPRFFEAAEPGALEIRKQGREAAMAVDVEPGATSESQFQLRVRLPELALPPSSADRLDQAIDSLREYDTFLPTFLAELARTLGPQLREELQADARALVHADPAPERVRAAMHEVQADLVEGLVDSISSRKNQSLFAKTSSEGRPPTPERLGVAKSRLLVDPSGAEEAAGRLDEALASADERLTELSRDLTIRPLADLLSIARDLLNRRTRNPVESAARLLAADACLGALQQAMEDEAFRPHLKGGRI